MGVHEPSRSVSARSTRPSAGWSATAWSPSRELTRTKSEADATIGHVIAADYAIGHLDADLTWLTATISRVAVMHTFASESAAGGGASYTCLVDDDRCQGGSTDDPAVWKVEREPEVRLTIPVPWTELARDGGIALAAVLATVALGLLFLRSSTELEEIRTT